MGSAPVADVPQPAGKKRRIAKERDGRIWFFESEEEAQAWELAQLPAPNRRARRAAKRQAEALLVGNPLAPIESVAQVAQITKQPVRSVQLPEIDWQQRLLDDDDDDVAFLLLM